MIRHFWHFFIALTLPLTIHADELVLKGTSIKANEGLPSVTFVVPWQSVPAPDYMQMPVSTVLDNALQLVDSSLLPVTESGTDNTRHELKSKR